MYYEKLYPVHNFDFDKNRKLKPMTVMNFLQDISTQHFETATAHVSEEVLKGLWVIVEWQVDFHQMPSLVSCLKVKTIPTYFRKFIAYRDYVIEDDAGNLIASGMSKWAYIDPISRKQVQIPKILNAIFSVREDADKPSKIEFETREENETLFQPQEMQEKISVYSDLDVNHHVNNITYLRWAIDSLGSQFMDGVILSSLKVNFKREVFEGEIVMIETHKKITADKAVTLHDIKTEKGELCVKVQLDWQCVNK